MKPAPLLLLAVAPALMALTPLAQRAATITGTVGLVAFCDFVQRERALPSPAP